MIKFIPEYIVGEVRSPIPFGSTKHKTLISVPTRIQQLANLPMLLDPEDLPDNCTLRDNVVEVTPKAKP
jgi:hypothetical protein